MESRFVRILITILQTVTSVACVAVGVLGIFFTDGEFNSYYPYFASVLRTLALVLVTISFYKNSFMNNNSANLFTIFFLFFASLSETQSFSWFTSLTGWSLVPPRAIVRLILLSNIMIHVSVIGFAINYLSNEHTTVSRYLVISLTASILLSFVLPSTQGVSGLWHMHAPFLLLSVLALLAILSHAILLIVNKPSGSEALKQVATILLVVGSYNVTALEGIIPCLIGTGFYLVGGAMLSLMYLRNSVIL